MERKRIYITLVSLAIITTVSIANQHRFAKSEKNQPQLKATLVSTDGNHLNGDITFSETEDDAILIAIEISGLKPQKSHAIHIHQYGDLTEKDGSSAGGHFNPYDSPHGLPSDPKHHAGDLGNFTADDKGVISETLEIKGITLLEGEAAVVGRAVVVHANKDHGTQPSGDAGPRIAVGVIGIKQTP